MVVKDCEVYLKHHKKGQNVAFIREYKRHISTCGNIILLKSTDEGLEYITARTCRDKLCAICNHNRKVALRRKYVLWLDTNPTIYEVQPGKYLTAAQCGAEYGQPQSYQLMALTLTVPHKNGTYKGEKVYYNQIISDFNVLRKKKTWKNTVFGGEFGVEATKNKDGLHIHIHALLLVRVFDGNRNFLHKYILLAWNKQTSGSGSYVPMDDVRRAAIKKGNNTITDADIDQLTTSGSTMIELENIYYKQFLFGKWTKIYPNQHDNSPKGREARIKAVLETISYHFKPKMFDIGDGHHDIQLLADIYAKTKGRSLYAKFGVFQKEKSLNLSYSGDSENDILEEELSSAKAIEQNTGDSSVDASTLGFMATFPNNVYVTDTNDIVIKNGAMVKDMPTTSTRQALKMVVGFELGKNNSLNQIN